MEYFEALAETLHFGRASALVGVTQPALSSQIAEMEERLGRKLFDRGARGVQLTDDGLALRPRIERLLSELREIEAQGRRERSMMEGRFRLGVIPTVAPYLLPSLLPRLRQRFPALVIELREAVTARLIEETEAGRLDGMIAALPLDSPSLVIAELFEDRFLLAVPASEPGLTAPPVPPEHPLLERLMLLEEGHCMRDQALAVCGNVRPTVMSNYGATSLTTLLQMVAHGQGVTLVPEMACTGTAFPDLRIVPFTEPMPSRRLAFAWRRNAARAEESRALASAIREFSHDVDGKDRPQQDHENEAQRERGLAVADPVGRHMDEGVDDT